SVDQVYLAGLNGVEDALLEIAAEAGGVFLRQSDVFVEVKDPHPLPVDTARLNRGEEGHLRHTGRQDQIGLATLGDGGRDLLLDEVGRGGTHLIRGGERTDQQ